MRSFLVGYSVSLADLACWGALKSIPVFTKQIKAGGDIGVYVTRWFNYLESLDYVISAVADVEKAKNTANKSNKDQGSFEIGLKDAAIGKVVTRFPPEPSGYLHIGHAKAALLNEYFARKYEGKMIVRFDDTNPSKEKVEFEESIQEDLTLIGIKPDIVSHTSDHFDTLYELAIKLIKKGLAFCDDSNQELMREERMNLINSKNRDLSVEENLHRFSEMTKGSPVGLKNCLRAKINMQDKNGTMRDPVIYRCNLEKHHRTGSKWKVYPTYDFACPVVDSIEGVTHALRTIEYRDRNPQYEWFLRALELRWVHIWDFSRISFVYTLLSKRKLTWFVEKGLVPGWDDPRFPTVRGIRRRGMTIQALREYILMQGASQRTLELEWDKIWALNKKIIDPVAPRHVALVREKIAKVTVASSDTFKAYKQEIAKHKKNPELGNKNTLFSPELYLEFADAKDLEVGEEVTLMDWGNVIIEKIDWSSDHSFIGEIVIRLNLSGDFKKTKKKLTWLARGIPEENKDLTPTRVLLMDYDYLITKKKLEDDDKVEDFVTAVSEFQTEAWGDGNLRFAKKGDIIQLERKGYYIVDDAYDAAKPSKPIKVISIPDGKVSSIASKSASDAAPAEVKTGSSGGSSSKKKQAKEEKAAAAATPAASSSTTINMYKSARLYGDLPKIKPEDACKMYSVAPVYGDKVVLFAEPAATNGKDAKKDAKPVKGEALADGSAKVDKKKEKKAAAEAPADAGEASLISKLDIVVGKILEVARHPDADSLYVEKIDVGEAEPRTVVSGLVKFMTEDEMKNKTILVLKNLKPAAMRGVKSHAMVLCASNSDHTKVEFLIPPAGSKPGDRVFFKGHEGTPDEQLNPKKKIFETLQPDFITRDDLVAVWKGVPFETAKGLVKAPSLKAASIK
ncbi:tRNA synthetases class I, catalytic domain-containing protein [Chytridium lagenaria]|nr:tRNA synthetases class I, catalytic domain-containing protein [Chytridium lagenaria]